MVNQQQVMMTFQTNVRFPYLPNVTKFADNPAMKWLTSVMLQFARSIEVTGLKPETTFTIILIMVVGVVRWQYRRNLRMKRMNENYI